MLYHGPVRVPDDARPGQAILRVRSTEESAFESIPTDIVVQLEGQPTSEEKEGND